MSVVGGDVTEITWNHPTLGSGTLFPKANEAFKLNIGGFRSDDGKNEIDGSGRAIRKMSRVVWSCEGTVACDTVDTKEQEAMVALSNDPQDASWTFTHINGSVYGGSGFPVGDLELDTLNATFTLKINGGATLQQIA